MRSTFKTSLAEGAPDNLIREWHPTKNGTLTPEKIGIGSTKKVWWLGVCGHEWQTSPNNRFHQGRITACPYCSGKAVSPDNNLAYRFPEIAAEWDDERNDELSPSEVYFRSKTKVWWRCSRNPTHEWRASIVERVKGTGCPKCYSHISKPHIRLYSEFLPIFPDLTIHKTIGALEFDLYNLKHSFAIEYDGAHWHKHRAKQDKAKNKAAKKHGVVIFRVREKELDMVSPNDISIAGRNVTKSDLVNLLNKMSDVISLKSTTVNKIRDYQKHKGFWNKDTAKELLSHYPGPLKGQSVNETHPDLVKEWDIELNKGLKPDDFTAGSRQVIQWTCRKGHHWEASIKRRSKGSGCPYCSGKAVAPENSLAAKNPELASQWHHARNGDLTPDGVTHKSRKMVWWLCPKNVKHEWQATIVDRHRYGCPYCSGRKVTKDKSFAAVMPELVKEWHPTKNKDLQPDTVSPQSSKKVWWQCATNPAHEWQATVGNRYRGSGCPYCSGRKAAQDTSLQAINPGVSKQWHPTKNGDLKPDQVRPNSHRKVWWVCAKSPEHEWEASIQSRHKGSGCPFCAGKRK